VKWPGHTPENTSSSELICFTDMLATFAELVDTEIDTKQFDSHSILPVISGNTYESPIRNELLIDKKALITNEWKYIEGHGGDGFNRAYSPSKERFQNLPRNEGELYHIVSDSAESRNLYLENADIAARMKQQLINVIK